MTRPRLLRVAVRLIARPWSTVLLSAGAGTAVFLIVSDRPQRAVLSYLAGLALVVFALEFGLFNIRMADRYVPGLSLAAAMFSYVTTVAALGVVLALASPRVVDPEAIASGLGMGLVIWLGYLMANTWVRPERGEHPVNISLQDVSPPDP